MCGGCGHQAHWRCARVRAYDPSLLWVCSFGLSGSSLGTGHQLLFWDKALRHQMGQKCG